MSASTTQAPSDRSFAAMAEPMPPAPPVTRATRPGEALGLRHALQLGFFEQPVFDVEGLLLRQARHSVDTLEAPRMTLMALT